MCACAKYARKLSIYGRSPTLSITVLQVKVQWAASRAEFLIIIIFSPEPARHWQFLFSGSLPGSLSKPHQLGLHAHTLTHTSVWNEDRFHVQGPSIIHGIFNVNRLLQFVTVSDLSLRWAAQFTSCFYPTALSCTPSLSHVLQLILWRSSHGKSANDLFGNNWLVLRCLFVLRRWSLDLFSPLLPAPPLGPVG